MKTILDEIEEVKNENKTYSILSFFNALISIGLILFFVLRIINFFDGAFGTLIQPELIFLIYFFLASGVVLAIISFIKKEPSNWMKWVGGVINLLFLFIILATIALAWFIKVNI